MQANAENIKEEFSKALESLPKTITKGFAFEAEPWEWPQIESPASLASCIDHTLLRADANHDDIRKICDEAKEHLFYSVCVNPYWVKEVSAQDIKASGIKITGVVGFPLGATHREVKVFETKQAINDGADEVDMVQNLGALKSKKYEYVYDEIRAIKEACDQRVLKVILETSLLSRQERLQAAIISRIAGANFLKTSTGFSSSGASIEGLKDLRFVAGSKLGVKASGGIRSFEQALQMIEAGANRLGCSSSVEIIKGASVKEGSY